MQYDARYTQRHINTLQYDARYTQRQIKLYESLGIFLYRIENFVTIIEYFVLRTLSLCLDYAL